MLGQKNKTRVYSVNKGIGFASSGVEYAQKYRMELLKGVDVNDYYVFLNYLSKNISVYTSPMGYQNEDVIWIYNYLSGRKTEKSTYTIADFLETIPNNYVVKEEKNCCLVQIEQQNIVYKIWMLANQIVDRIDYIVNGTLMNVMHFDQSLNNIEHYNKGKLARRSFFGTNGEVKYEQFYLDGKISLTSIDNQLLYGEYAFYRYFFERLKLSMNDAVIIDRPLDVIEGVLPVLTQNTRVYSVIHAEHYNESLSSDVEHILWNNNYEYTFEHAESFTGIIVSTDRQKEILDKQLTHKTMIKTIPVGYIDKQQPLGEYQPQKLITASRLAVEKHIDVIVKAVANLRSVYPKLTLDIYGEGGKRGELKQLIKELKADEYIFLKGHSNLTGVYRQYDAYVSASTSEGFGLSLLEAISENLPLIGVDVEYGNREFIDSGKNGVLYKKVELKELHKELEKAIIDYYEQKIDQIGRANSRQKAAKYLKETISQQWQELLVIE